MVDILLIEPNASSGYQSLAQDFSAIETPTWCLLLAGAIRSRGYSVAILDANAERLSLSQTSSRVLALSPRLVLFSCYGQNPNSSTPFFGSGLKHAETLRSNDFKGLIAFVGPHVAALPRETLAKHGCIDLVLCNEGIFQIFSLLKSNFKLDDVRGIAYRRAGHIFLNPAEEVPSQAELESVYPGYAWDLLPFKESPLDLYRSHLWHSDFGNLPRTPFAAVYTSLGCTFRCSFCMINMINRDSNDVQPIASNFNRMRFFSAEWLQKEFDYLKSVGVRTLRIADEMFYLNRNHYKPILEALVNGKYFFNMWAYTRVDTIRVEYLSEFKRAGINWLCVGIEAGDDGVRSDVFKGKFRSDLVRENVAKIQEAGIKVLANFIVGLPTDDEDTIKRTFDMAINLNAEYSNFYPCMSLPGTELYINSLSSGAPLPDSYTGYGFLSYDCVPMPTAKLSSEQVLRLRDEGVRQYMHDPRYEKKFLATFGEKAFGTLRSLRGVKIRRRLLSD